MNEHDDFDRSLARWFEAEARPAATSDVLERSLRATSRSRPRPGLFAALGSHWVGDDPGAISGALVRGRTGRRAAFAMLLLVLALGLVAGVALVGARLQSAPPIDRLGHLAYVMPDGLYVGDWDGRNARRIMSLEELPHTIPEACRGSLATPTWSPDGRHLAVRTAQGDQCGGYIVVTDAEGSSLTAMPGYGWSIAWSPDSRRIVTWIDFRSTLAVYGVDGQREALLDGPAVTGDHDPAWTPDGLAVRVRSKVVPLDGSEQYLDPRLSPRPRAQMSPDGTWVAYAAGSSIVLSGTNGSAQRALGPFEVQRLEAIVWAPTSDRIGFRADGSRVATVDVATGVSTLLSAPPGEHSVIDLTPKGDRLLVATYSTAAVDGRSALWVVDADGSEPRKIVDGSASGDWQWLAPGSAPESPSPGPTSTPESLGSMWPQTSLEEVREAQEAADAGNPRYPWQLNSALGEGSHLGQHHPHDAELFARFLGEKLGWEAFLWNEAFAHPEGLEPGAVVYVRCAPGGTNPLYGDRAKGPGAGCGPTIDGIRYETVKITAAQLDRQGPLGIWVVTGWEMIEPFEQVAPPSDAEISALLGPFLQARLDGAGAEGFVDVADDATSDVGAPRGVPLLYGTSTGAAYERSEFEVVDGPVWPEGSMQLEVRLFADDDRTVVEQAFSVVRDGTGALRLLYSADPPTTEDGRSVPDSYGFLDGEVTFRAASPLAPSEDGFRGQDRLAIDAQLPDDDVPRRILVLLADPRTVDSGCLEGPSPADAQTLARSIGSDPDLQVTTPVAVTVGGLSGLRMDVVPGPGASSCPYSDPDPDLSATRPLLFNDAPFGVRGNRARVWLLDLPGGSARVLAIVMITDDDSFETVLEWAAPVVDSIEFHAP